MKSHQHKSPTRIIGHRGASYDAPENTLAAFELAWQQAADGVEGDFHVTRDGYIVCIHDYDTQRTGGQRLVIADSHLSQLQLLEYGSWKAAQFAGQPMPRVADIVAGMPKDKWLVMELKTGPEIVAPLRQEFQRHGLITNRVLLIAFDQRTIAECKRQMPDVAAHWLTDYKRDTGTGHWSPTLDEVIQTIQSCGADGLGTENRTEVVTPQYIDSLRNAGIDQFHVWTVDDAEQAKYYREQGAWGITTNRPAFIRNALTDTLQEIPT